MSIGVKICGITEPASLETAIEYGADWVGFVFFPRSPRFLTPAQGADLSIRMPTNGPARVGLFVKAQDADIQAALDEVPLDILQIYDTPSRAAEIRNRFGLPVWLAYGVSTRSDLPAYSDLDGLLIEARPQIDALRPGGNGQSFDWRLTQNWHPPAPWMLAGGLTPENVSQAIAISGAQAVDVSSGVETTPGVKSAEKIRTFIQNARSTCARSKS
ncbi:phosphoribosylanthranilate isomerase [Kozakia baliensis]|uniref:phosphoribosylanthranilate isomerase n=1 Tax=Kozakia baliensis TaxID=153496 RepID=UPI00087D1880|nr:phosphoribosylanthranilate isomerase [Kozakia baliensis]AOX19021.1 N-(5'-phosphoribosyl)anthranilate isomerase [Kozakia baliensis]